MAVMDEFKEEREALKHGTFKQKVQYFWEYYRWHTLAVILIGIFAFYMIYMYATKKEEILYGAILNCYALENAEAYSREFVEYAGYDPEKYEAGFDSTVSVNFDEFDVNASASAEKLAMYMAAYQLDVMIAGDQIFENYANGGTFTDIRDHLTEEQIAEYEPYFYYVDFPLVQQIYEAETNTDTSFDPEIPDPSKPELMEDPIPVGIYVESCEGLMNNYVFQESSGKRVVLGIVSNTTRPEMTAQFIDYLFKQ